MRLFRKMSSGRAIVAERANYLIANKAEWEKIIPKSSSVHTDFYEGERNDKQGLDYSLNILWDMLERKGKMIRPVLMLILTEMYGGQTKDILPFAYLVETVHNATLIVDDIEDGGEVRKGEPCAHLKYGVDYSINAGCLAYFLPFYNAMKADSVRALPVERQMEIYKLYVEEMKNIHLGLAWDIHWHNSYEHIPSFENFYQMIESKTSVLLRIGFRLVAQQLGLKKQEENKLVALANDIGKSFQIKDDLINLKSLDYAKGRSGYLGEDITEGKLTLMALHHLQTAQKKDLLDILKLKTKDPSLIGEAIQLMESSGSLEYCERKQREWMESAVRGVEALEVAAKERRFKRELLGVMGDLLERSV
jgi:geranylgeranyl pyrophosphate synthase